MTHSAMGETWPMSLRSLMEIMDVLIKLGVIDSDVVDRVGSMLSLRALAEMRSAGL